MNRKLGAIIDQYFGDLNYTLDIDQLPQHYKIGKCPLEEQSVSLPPELRIKIIRQPKSKIVKEKRAPRGKTKNLLTSSENSEVLDKATF